MNLTPIAKMIFRRNGLRITEWKDHSADIQLRQLLWLLFKGADTEYGRQFGFEAILSSSNPKEEFAKRVPLREYEDMREDIMRSVRGEKSVLWPGRCINFAQSSGTSGGRSKYIPVTRDSLRVNHYAGSSDVVAQYLRCYPESRMFAGKGLILGGSFASELKSENSLVKIGDLSATLIDSINPLANLFRVPSKKIALMSDWNEKLDLIAESAAKANISNISGVPSWMLRLILRALEISGKSSASELWPNLEVFFHGGISFEPYRSEYARLTDPKRMHFFETYNASEGFFATQYSRDPGEGMLLLIDRGVYYEFLPAGADPETTPTLTIEQIQEGRIYEMIITCCNGLWRYRIGDTIEVVATDPLRIKVAGRTHSFINAFGEELMENNAERAIAAACSASGALIRNYTAGPLYAKGNRKGRHQWLVEFDKAPDSLGHFSEVLDDELKRLNSDYAAKREGGLFLDAPEIIVLPQGSFDRWLHTYGSGKLGGQRKIPRLHNDRTILGQLINQ